ncbi:MAG TPA: DNA repair protein RecN [Abditibacteriaceae bacterium]|jgi:DNA repair protein RecN (Recombination protein N)
MLHEIRIFNLALIDRADISFGPGLNVLTGETGAGKSVLIHALGLLVGERATSEQVGKAEAKARVEGLFDISQSPRAKAFLEAQDIAYEDDQLIVQREVSADGRSRVRCNGQLVTASLLRELGASLVDLHGQHEHQLLLRAETHLGFLDEFGDAAHQTLREQTSSLWESAQAARKRLDELSASEQQRAQRLDMLGFQAQEIDNAKLEADEDTALIDERARLMNAEKLRDAAALCRDALSGTEEAGAVQLLAQALRAAREIESFDASVSEWTEEIQSALYEIEDAAAQASAYADALDADPLRLEDIEARLHLLTRLKRKYGDSIARVLEYRAGIEDELSRLNLSEEELSALRDEADAHRARFLAVAEKLSQSRQKLAKRFSTEVVSHLQTLAMEKTRFEVGFERGEGSADGIDVVEFLFQANPGQPLRPLARIASGGEISRVMLALRSALFAPQSDDPASGVIPILVFDEVDTGIGGVTAESVGIKMRELARGFQVFCVTHLPQIARRADSHFRVLKESDDARTLVSVTRLDGEDRVRELARMMGGETESTLRHAQELLAENGTAKPKRKKK